MALLAPGYNDAVLFFSLVYSCVDLALAWDRFGQCIKPLHHWLLISFVAVLTFRSFQVILLYVVDEPNGGERAESWGAHHEIFSGFRQKGALPRALAVLTWAAGLPFFAAWTAVGTSWLWQVARQTPHCVPFPAHLWFSGVWLALCYTWLGIHASLGILAVTFEWRVRRAEADLRGLADEDTERRWGPVADLAAGQAAAAQGAGPGGAPGLAPDEIRALPRGACASTALECPVCIMDIEPGEDIRVLPSCGHSFHAGCIDLWLLRRAECPLCKRDVRAPAACAGEWI